MLGTFGLVAYTFPWLALMFIPMIIYIVSSCQTFGDIALMG